jgi:Type VI secretion system (T6SS), amidase effector protein 4
MALIFKTMWDNHPSNLPIPDNFPCKHNGAPAFDNQCAIKLGIALQAGGMNMRTAPTRCWFKNHPIHVLRAQESANWLSSGAALGSPTKFKSKQGENLEKTVLDSITGKKGIVFCQDFWAPTPGGPNVGDHIDLWNGIMMAHGFTNYFAQSKQVWFWGIST